MSNRNRLQILMPVEAPSHNRADLQSREGRVLLARDESCSGFGGSVERRNDAEGRRGRVQGWIRPRRIAYRTRAAVPRSLSFLRIRARCESAVFTLTPRIAAISLL